LRVGDIVKYWNPFWETYWMGMVLEIKEGSTLIQWFNEINHSTPPFYSNPIWVPTAVRLEVLSGREDEREDI